MGVDLPGENSSDRVPIVRLHRSGSPLDRDDDILIYENGKITIRLGGRERPGIYAFDRQEGFVDVLLDYLFNSLKFFGLQSTYENEERVPEQTTVGIPDRVWGRSSLDSVYMIRADVFNRQNEIAFSYSRCPDSLWRLRMLIDKVFYSAEEVSRNCGDLVDLVSELVV